MYFKECSNECESNDISTLDIIFAGDHGQGKFRYVYKFILRDMNVIKIDSYIIKNAHIYHEKDTYEVLTALIIKHLNDEVIIIMKEVIYF